MRNAFINANISGCAAPLTSKLTIAPYMAGANRRFHNGRVGMRGIAGEINPVDCGMRGEPAGDLARVRTVALHADRKRFDAAHRKISFERPQHRAERAGQRLEDIQLLAFGDDHAGKHIAVTGQIFREAVDRVCRAVLKWTYNQQRRGERAVDNQFRVGLSGHDGDVVKGRHASDRIGDRPSASSSAPGRNSVIAAATAASSLKSTKKVSTPEGASTFMSMLMVAP